jgi:hypothetical protein
MQVDFISKLEHIQRAHQSRVALTLAPYVSRMPGVIQKYDDPFFPFSKAIIQATRDVVCAYVFDFAAYLAIGAAGAIALERTVAYARGDTVTILHGPFASPSYVHLMDENAFGVDAVTLDNVQYLDHYITRRDRSAFVVARGEPTRLDAPHNGGIYWLEAGLFTTIGSDGSVIDIQLADEAALYAVSTPDFAERTRDLVDQMRDAQ